ncbi:unnamed protein product [Symbiodinium natans]|uniref:Uncharacterized protein n=1 Tax=Symbiodinium natans TaxID=878477 RepID=A0A812JQG9_9DINO|nr:unnamed protein product [Symbiodinium natans]
MAKGAFGFPKLATTCFAKVGGASQSGLFGSSKGRAVLAKKAKSQTSLFSRAASPPDAARGKRAGLGQQEMAESEAGNSAPDGRWGQVMSYRSLPLRTIWSERPLRAATALKSVIDRISRAFR